MKKLMMSLLFFISVSNCFAGKFLKCEAIYYTNVHAGIIEGFSAECVDNKDQRFSIYFEGVGPGLRMSHGYFALSCPNVREVNFVTTYKGLKVTAVPAVGASIAVIFNKNMGSCILTGFDVGLGGGVSIGKMIVRKI